MDLADTQIYDIFTRLIPTVAGSGALVSLLINAFVGSA